MLTKNLNDLRDANNQQVEVTKLVTALESEQLGASRAVQQNRQLKEQLTDMENAFVSLVRIILNTNKIYNKTINKLFEFLT